MAVRTNPLGAAKRSIIVAVLSEDIWDDRAVEGASRWLQKANKTVVSTKKRCVGMDIGWFYGISNAFEVL